MINISVVMARDAHASGESSSVICVIIVAW